MTESVRACCERGCECGFDEGENMPVREFVSEGIREHVCSESVSVDVMRVRGNIPMSVGTFCE